MRFYEELNEFLSRDHEKRAFEVEIFEPRSVKDIIESQGVPHTEIDLILVDGESVGFEYLVDRPARITVYPAFQSMDVAAASRLGRPPLRQVRFVADVHLGRLARLLRLLGFDCVYSAPWDDAILATRSAAEHRILLTRDCGLLKRSVVTHGMFIHSDDPSEQVRDVVRKLDLYQSARPFSRCAACNGLLQPISRESARSKVPPRTYGYAEQFLQCDSCGKVFWKGTHWQRLNQLVERALERDPKDHVP
ncbi:MAG: hypothetical protein A3K19_07905 [Lentisphaerae bacterium RIFOXYB12_FULL_65_16]|nr:MAG: hypothetical protein A3K18_31780 [Lentisphaerae bacterium RIFOXYA12_64_32]OGV87595.1 MAG: hypothetical protein A3K19_07905 [Lentisphaerae bacterium RIFOXYB12_FULL_65_16]